MHTHPLMKKILSIITAAMLTSSSVFAAPFTVPSINTTSEESIFEVTPSIDEENLTQSESKAVIMQADVVETTDEKPTNEAPSNAGNSDASLMLDFYAEGDGTEAAPYEINNEMSLVYFSQMVNSGNHAKSHFKLTDNIDLNGKSWTPVGFYNNDTEYKCSFQGSFDGNGYTISNFKITSNDTPYVGFFGLIFNGSVKNLNLDNFQIDLDRNNIDTKATYVGGIAGRLITEGVGAKSEISNCHVTNATISISSDKEVCAAGLVGFALAGINTKIDVFDVSADCTLNVSVNATEFANSSTTPPKCYNAFGSALFSYFGALTGSTISFRNASASGSVTVDTSLSDKVYNFSGGVFAQMATRVSNEAEIGGTAYINGISCDVDVTAMGQRPVFTGGFAGNIGATENLELLNCYASGNVNGQTSAASPTAGWLSIGGFVGQLDYGVYADSMGKSIFNCYASGDVIDTMYQAGKKVDSYGGGFVGYSFAPVFKTCYSLASQNVISPEISSDSEITVIPADKETDISSYPSFDFNSVWQMDASLDYPYPTLREIFGYVIFQNEGKYFAETSFGSDGKAVIPSAIPGKKGNEEWEYTFSHWSLTENGEAFDSINEVLTENTILHAVYTGKRKIYSVTFMSEGKQFGSVQSIVYGGTPSALLNEPKKPDSGKFRYQFHHWSLTEGGEEIKLSEVTVTSNITLYAVFTEINKTAWKGEIASSFSDGHGTEILPYVITSAEEFALMAKLVNDGDEKYKNAYYVLGDDIHLGYYTWTPAGTLENPFSAHFDGAGYSISCYTVKPSDYMGLFGYVCNGEIKNFYVSDFEIKVDGYTSDKNIYVGAVAGYVCSNNTNSIIENISVNGSKFDVNVSSEKLYAGGLVGYAESNLSKTLITNCFVTNAVSAKNTAEKSTTYAGGIAGYIYTYADGSLTKLSNSYYIGSVTASGDIKCCAAGLVGSVYSYGSAYIPPVILGKEEGTIQEEIKDYDIMLENCFVIANISASSNSELSSNTIASATAGEVSQHAAVNNIFFQRGSKIISTGNIATYGISTSSNSLLSKDFISDSLKFDFVNVWTYVGTGKYPVLKVMYSDKPTLRINNLTFENGTLQANITAFAKSADYTVMVGIYNERNQFVAFRKQRFYTSDSANEFEINVSGIPSVYRIKVSAYDSLSFKPLFTSLEWFV